MNPTHIRVEKNTRTGALMFFAYRSAHLRVTAGPLTYEHEETSDPLPYATYEEAYTVCCRYEFGLPDNVREARWDSNAGDWEVIETFRSSYGDADREDFHADG